MEKQKILDVETTLLKEGEFTRDAFIWRAWEFENKDLFLELKNKETDTHKFYINNHLIMFKVKK